MLSGLLFVMLWLKCIVVVVLVGVVRSVGVVVRVIVLVLECLKKLCWLLLGCVGWIWEG